MNRVINQDIVSYLHLLCCTYFTFTEVNLGLTEVPQSKEELNIVPHCVCNSKFRIILQIEVRDVDDIELSMCSNEDALLLLAEEESFLL